MSPPSPPQPNPTQMIPPQGFGMVPPPYSEQNVYNNNYPPGYLPNSNAFNYDYNPVNQLMQGTQNSYQMYSNMMPPTGSEFQSTSWNNTVPPPATVNIPSEPAIPNPAIDEEKQKREGKYNKLFKPI